VAVGICEAFLTTDADAAEAAAIGRVEPAG